MLHPAILRRGRLLFALIGVVVAGAARAGQPMANEPLQIPYFSIDLFSPTATGALHADDVLTKPGPMVAFPNFGLGLGRPGDELDGISTNRNDIMPGQSFGLIFSVDRATMGAVPPDPGLVALGFPYNAMQQASLNQAAGDAFMSTGLFDRSGPVSPFSRVGGNNVLVINQGDSGGVDHDLDPDVSPSTPVPPGDPVDNADAYGGGASSALRAGPPTGLFFTASANSPSLFFLPTPASGASIYFDPDPLNPGDERLYADPFQLGLTEFDDINGLVVFDNGNNVFEPTIDQIIFSLSRDSASLELGFSAADVLTSSGGGSFALLASAADLGLGHNDSVDALELLRTDDIMDSIIRHAIFPEPSTLLMLAAGAWVLRRRRA